MFFFLNHKVAFFAKKFLRYVQKISENLFWTVNEPLV